MSAATGDDGAEAEVTLDLARLVADPAALADAIRAQEARVQRAVRLLTALRGLGVSASCGGEPMGVRKAVLHVLADHPAGLSARDLADAVTPLVSAKLKRFWPSFYSTISRLYKTGEVRREGHTYFPVNGAGSADEPTTPEGTS